MCRRFVKVFAKGARVGVDVDVNSASYRLNGGGSTGGCGAVSCVAKRSAFSVPPQQVARATLTADPAPPLHRLVQLIFNILLISIFV